MAEASKTIEIKASIKDCYKVISDYESYPEFLKETKSITIGKKSGKTVEVTYELDLIKAIRYTLKITENAPHGLSWTLVKGDMMKSNTGSWELEEIDKHTTRATYNIDIGLGLLVPGSVAKMLVSSSLPAMMEAFKKRIEGTVKKKK